VAGIAAASSDSRIMLATNSSAATASIPSTITGASRVSIPSVAVDLALSLLGDLESRHVLILGAGETSELTARALAEHPLQLTQRLAALPVGVGMNQIVERFRLGQIELAILEPAPGKLARLSGAYLVRG